MAIRGYVARINWMRFLAIIAGIVFISAINIEPALAFSNLASGIVQKAKTVAEVFKVILFTMAVISVLVGVAPMLWGEVRVKWVVSALVACTIISMIEILVNAFVDG